MFEVGQIWEWRSTAYTTKYSKLKVINIVNTSILKVIETNNTFYPLDMVIPVYNEITFNKNFKLLGHPYTCIECQIKVVHADKPKNGIFVCWCCELNRDL